MEDLAAAQVTRHLQLDYFPSSMLHSMCFVASKLAASLQLTDVNSVASGIRAGSFGCIFWTGNFHLGPWCYRFHSGQKVARHWGKVVSSDGDDPESEERSSEQAGFCRRGASTFTFQDKAWSPSKRTAWCKAHRVARTGTCRCRQLSSNLSLSFYPKKGLATTKINKLTAVQIDELEWYYNEIFHSELCRIDVSRKSLFVCSLPFICYWSGHLSTTVILFFHGRFSFYASRQYCISFRRRFARPLPCVPAISPRERVSKGEDLKRSCLSWASFIVWRLLCTLCMMKS